MRKDVFISYSKDDREAAEQVCTQLEEAGIGCWIAPRDIAPGVTWPTAITDAIRSCRAMVVVFSSNANRSPHMAREVEVADSRHVPILPVRVENIEPAGDMEYFLGNRQWFDLHGGKIERRRALPDAIASLLRDAPGGDASEPTPAPTPRPVVRKKSGMPIWAVLAGSLVLAGGGVAAYFMSSRPAPAPAPAPQPTTATAPVQTPPPVAEAPSPFKQAPVARAKVTPPPAATTEVAPAKPPADFAGKWQAEIKYNWGAVHKETFNFKVDDKELYGTASYLRTPRGILDGKIDGNKISFTTKSQSILGDKTYEEKHHYRGRLTPDGIEFMLQTDSGYDSRSPETFTAKRVE